MTFPVVRSCFRTGCELADTCALFKREKAHQQIYPQHCGFRCDFYEKKDDLSERIFQLAGCLQ